MDTEEQARQQIEEELEQIGVDAGMADSRATATSRETWAGYETEEGYVHYFTFAPTGEDTIELPQ
jgi:hypothetical protein